VCKLYYYLVNYRNGGRENSMREIKFYTGNAVPLEMHKVRIVQKLNLLPIDDRLKAICEAGNNTFLLRNKDTFLDMLTDSGVNAMSDIQLSAMMTADDSYAGSATFSKMESKLQEIFGTKYVLPAHQGRACEHIIAKVLVKKGDIVPMNYHFTTTKAHICLQGGKNLEIHYPEALIVESNNPFTPSKEICLLSF
jgi:tryptophanase